MASVTAATAVIALSIPLLFPTPQLIQGFATDDVFDVPAIQSVELMMGVDGIQSAGFVFVSIPWTFTLQADSASNDFFDTWWEQMQAAKDVFRANGTVRVPSLGKKWNLITGDLTNWKPAPDAKKLLQPRKHTITWNSIVPAPI